MDYSPTTDIPAVGRCQACKQSRATRPVSFYRNGRRSVRSEPDAIHAKLCKSCIHKKYWEFMGKNLLYAPLGIFRMFLAPIYAVQNTAVYLKALHKLRGVPE
jgi:hypothetical protein